MLPSPSGAGGAVALAPPDVAASGTEPEPALIDLHPAPADLEQVVLEGMARSPRQLPAWLLYDETGSQLFEAIAAQPEYTLTRTETALLEAMAPELAAALTAEPAAERTEGLSAERLPPPAATEPLVLVEFGAGNLRKVDPLLRALQPAAYAALDISADPLEAACRALRRRHPRVPVVGVCCDYTRLNALPSHPLLRGERRLGFFPGSSLGNYEPAQACALLRHFGTLLGPGSRLLIGIDQPKAVERLEAAYDDAAGVSAAFALNLLQRLNRELGGDFNPAAFRYRARWQEEHQRIAMALVSCVDQTVTLAGRPWTFAAEEALITEYSIKYSPEAFLALARQAGWLPLRRWRDPADDLSLHLLIQADSPPGQADSSAAHLQP